MFLFNTIRWHLCQYRAYWIMNIYYVPTYAQISTANLYYFTPTCFGVNILLTYLLTVWSRVLLEKLTDSQLIKKFPTFYGTRRFITAFTSPRHLFLSWASSIHSVPPHPTSWRYILILSSHLRLGLPSGLFPSVFPTTNLYAPLPSPTRATCPVHLILVCFITRTMLIHYYKLLTKVSSPN